jgi:hypothetical protein
MNTDDALKEAIHQVAVAKVNEALGGDILGKMISEIMEYTRPRNYSRTDDKPRPWIEELAVEQLKAHIEITAQEMIRTTYRDQIQAAVIEMLDKHLSVIAAKMVDKLTGDRWGAQIKLEIERDG